MAPPFKGRSHVLSRPMCKMTKSVCDFQSSKTVRTSESGPSHSDGVSFVFSMDGVVRGGGVGRGPSVRPRSESQPQKPKIRFGQYHFPKRVTPHTPRSTPLLPSLEPPRPPRTCYKTCLVVTMMSGTRKIERFSQTSILKILRTKILKFLEVPECWLRRIIII